MAQIHSSDRDVDVDLGKLFASIVRDWKRILLVAIAVAAAALVLSSLATRYYKAETKIIIGARESVFTRPQADAGTAEPNPDQEGVMSEVEVINSTNILKQVAKEFDFAGLEEFQDAVRPNIIERALIVVGLKADPAELQSEERVLEAFRDRLKIYRVESSRVIAIEFSSQSPKLAADVPNAIANAYLAFNRDAKLQTNTDATAWLEPEIQALTAKVKAAEARVAVFRSQSDLMMGENNSTLITQQLAEMSTELSRTRANRAAAEANAESVKLALSSGGSLDAFPDVISSDLIQRLRERQVQLRADIADLSTTLLDNHPRLRSMRSQLADMDSQVASEAQKILQGLSNAAASARLRESQLVTDVNRLKAESSRANEKEVELRSLEREAAAQRDLLESYLARYREASSRRDGNYQPADARVVSTAVTPVEPYFPKVVPITGAAFAASLLIMGIATLLSELFSGRAMRAAAGGRFEPVEQIRMPEPARVAGSALSGSDEAAEPGVDGLSVGEAAQMLIASGAARALFISPEGDEAAASAVLVAREMADAGLRVLLIDLTEAGAASLPMLDGTRASGITNLLASEAKFVDVIHADRYSDCHVIPVGTADAAKAMRAVERLPIILETLGTAYDVLVVECGPAGPDNIRRLIADGTEILISVIELSAELAELQLALEAAGFAPVALVTPSGLEMTPVPGRSAA